MTAAAVLADARTRLVDAPREALGVRRNPRRILGVGRSPRITRHGVAWHLGVLLLTDDAVLGTGEIVRARREVRRGYTAESQRARAALAAAARRGGFAEGEIVHFDWTVIDLDAIDRGESSGPLDVQDGVPVVRWSNAGSYMPLAAYLDERVELLLKPPAGA